MENTDALNDAVVTVCVPTYRRPEMLHQCLASIAAQTINRSKLRVIISDNAPEIDKSAILASFPGLDLHYFAQPVNLGMAGNIFFLTSQVQTEFAIFIPDDERIKPQHLERVLHTLEENPELSAAYSGYEVVDEQTGSYIGCNVPILVRLEGTSGDITWNYDEILAMLAVDTHVYSPCMVFRLSAMKSIFSRYKHLINAFYSNEKIVFSLLADFGPIRYVNESLLIARVGHHNVSADIDEESKQADQNYSSEWVLNHAYSRGIDIPKFWRERLIRYPKPIQQEILGALQRAFGEDAFKSIFDVEFSQFQNSSRFGTFEPAWSRRLLPEILHDIPGDLPVYSHTFHSLEDMPKSRCYPIANLSFDSVPVEFAIIDLVPELALFRIQTGQKKLPDHIKTVIVAMPFLGSEPWGEAMHFSRAIRVLLDNGFTITQHSTLNLAENKVSVIPGLNPEKWGERAKNLASSYLADGIMFTAVRQNCLSSLGISKESMNEQNTASSYDRFKKFYQAKLEMMVQLEERKE